MFRRYLRTVFQRGRYCRTELESLGQQCRFLDLLVTIESNRVVCTPAFKPTSLRVPLDATSAHHPSVHASWPISVAQNLFLKSSTLSGALEAKASFVDRFRRYFAPSWLIRDLTMLQGIPHRAAEKGQDPNVINQFWLPIPFHPAWYRQISKAIADWMNTPLFLSIVSLFGGSEFIASNCRVRLCWRNAMPGIARRFASVNSDVLAIQPNGWMAGV